MNLRISNKFEAYPVGICLFKGNNKTLEQGVKYVESS